MGLLYKSFNHACMSGMEWGLAKGKERVKKEESKNQPDKINFYSSYCKMDSILKRKDDIEESESILNDIYEDYNL